MDNMLNMVVVFLLGIFAGLAMMSSYVSKDAKNKKRKSKRA